MSADPAEKHATYQDVLDAPEGLVAEILGGELFTHPRPAGPHSEAASVLGMDIGGAFTAGAAGRVGGSSSTSRRSTSATTYWYPTSPAGGASGCRPCPTRPSSS